ncbi:MAG: vWA domain-containing protein [Planctomycetota bacterium]
MNRFVQFAENPVASGPETMFLVIDASPSMEEDDWKPNRLAGAVTAAKALLDVKSQHYASDKVCLITFHREARMMHPPAEVGANRPSLDAALDKIRTSACTNIAAGLEMVRDVLDGKQRVSKKIASGVSWLDRWLFEAPSTPDTNGPAVRGVRAILLSDGGHNVPYAYPVKTAKTLKKRGVVIDVIGIGNPKDLDETCLRKIASANEDGSVRYCFIGEQDHLVREFKKLAHHIRLMGGDE